MKTRFKQGYSMIIKSTNSIKELHFVSKKEKDAFLAQFETKEDNQVTVILARLLRRIEANKHQTLQGFACTSFLYDDEFAILQEANPDFLKSMRSFYFRSSGTEVVT